MGKIFFVLIISFLVTLDGQQMVLDSCTNAFGKIRYSERTAERSRFDRYEVNLFVTNNRGVAFAGHVISWNLI